MDPGPGSGRCLRRPRRRRRAPPGLRRRRRAVAEVDLRTLAVRYGEVRLAPASSRCARFAARCVPRRSALWLGDRRLAVFGEDAVGPRSRAGAGVRLVDLPQGRSARSIRVRAAGARLAGATLLTFGGGGGGVRGFGLNGGRRFRRFPGRRVTDVQLAGGYALRPPRRGDRGARARDAEHGRCGVGASAGRSRTARGARARGGGAAAEVGKRPLAARRGCRRSDTLSLCP